MIAVLLWLWQLPQHLAALIFWGYLRFNKIILRTEKGPGPGKYIIRIKGSGRGVSLGRFVFLYERHGETAIRHENGHSRQSQYLGPLYIIVIGIYSAMLGPRQNWFMKGLPQAERDKWYYSRWTEAWADSLGGVVRTFM
jgi:hypothetical protein